MVLDVVRIAVLIDTEDFTGRKSYIATPIEGTSDARANVIREPSLDTICDLTCFPSGP